MKRFFIFIVVIHCTLLSISQLNETYVNKELQNLATYVDKGKFYNGYIYTGSDSTACMILKFRGSKKRNHYLFCIAKVNDSIKTYTSDDITGYTFNGARYISHKAQSYTCFLKQVKHGMIDLYEKVSIPDEPRFLYYLQFENSEHYFILDPFENNVKIHATQGTSTDGGKSGLPSITYFESKGIDEKFKSFVANNLRFCPEVVNMVNSDFYTINDIPNIVEAYNNCFDF